MSLINRVSWCHEFVFIVHQCIRNVTAPVALHALLYVRITVNAKLFILSLQESAKVSDLNPNAKAWGNHVPNLEATGTAYSDTLQTLVETSNGPAGSVTEGKP